MCHLTDIKDNSVSLTENNGEQTQKLKKKKFLSKRFCRNEIYTVFIQNPIELKKYAKIIRVIELYRILRSFQVNVQQNEQMQLYNYNKQGNREMAGSAQVMK